MCLILQRGCLDHFGDVSGSYCLILVKLRYGVCVALSKENCGQKWHVALPDTRSFGNRMCFPCSPSHLWHCGSDSLNMQSRRLVTLSPRVGSITPKRGTRGPLMNTQHEGEAIFASTSHLDMRSVSCWIIAWLIPTDVLPCKITADLHGKICKTAYGVRWHGKQKPVHK